MTEQGLLVDLTGLAGGDIGSTPQLKEDSNPRLDGHTHLANRGESFDALIEGGLSSENFDLQQNVEAADV